MPGGKTMEIHISEEAVAWYKKEYEVEQATFRFFVRYGGMGGNVPGFSLGITQEPPHTIHTSTTVKGVEFFIADTDVWYFEDKDLTITYDEKSNEPQFAYQ
jgi:uncharacterized protein YneR